MRVDVTNAAHGCRGEIVFEQSERTRADLRIVAGQIDEIRRVDHARIDCSLLARSSKCFERRFVDWRRAIRTRIAREDLNRGAFDPLRILDCRRIAGADTDMHAQTHVRVTASWPCTDIECTRARS